MSAHARLSRERDELRRTIVEAATELFVSEGYESVSMRRIAERIDYAPSTIYLYFRDKADLVGSICREAFSGLESRLDADLAAGMPPAETLRHCLKTYVQFGLEHPRAYGFVFRALPGADGSGGCALGAYQRLRSAVLACPAGGGGEDGDRDSLGQSTWLLAHGIVAGLLAETGLPFVERERLIDESVEQILRGISGV